MPNAESVRILDSAWAHTPGESVPRQAKATARWLFIRLLQDGFYSAKDNLKLIIDGVWYDAVIYAENTKMFAGMSVSKALNSVHEIDVSNGCYGKPMYGGLVVAMSVAMP